MLGELRGRHLRGEPRGSSRKYARCGWYPAARVYSCVNRVVRETLDAKAFGALAQAEMQDEARPMSRKEAGTEPADLGPFGGKNIGAQRAFETRRARSLRQHLREPSGRIVGDAGKWANSGNEHARASHAFGLNRPAWRRKVNFACDHPSLMPARCPSFSAAAVGVISPLRTFFSIS